MSDFAPPSGPPPPKVPAGWKAVWNDQYKEWFYVNTYTKASTWEKPTEPVYPSGDSAPAGPPPSYDHSSGRNPGPEKPGLGSNNPYGGSNTSGSSSTANDEALARRLQEEEQARARGNNPPSSANRGASDGYYNTSNQYGTNPNLNTPNPSGPPSYSGGASPAPPEKRGFFSKLTGGSSSSPRPPQQGGYGGYPPQGGPQGGYGGYPPQQGGPGYGQNYGQGYQGYYPPQQQQQPQYVQQQQQKKHGLGAGGGALLGAGAGLLGGALLMDAFEDHEQAAYDQGYKNGEMADDGGYGGDDGGDFGGGDF